MTSPKSSYETTGSVENTAPLHDLLKELRAGLNLYWKVAHEILNENGVLLKELEEESYSYSNNFFSLLFLYSFYRANIPPQRRILYSAVLQCLRGMVTGCDNLLDDEYKMTLDTDIPSEGYRFRSVVDIMISDRVLFQLFLDAYHMGDVSSEKVRQVSTASMKSMMRSGIEEASEESGVTEILAPETVLKTIHHLKTGVLFTCPWDIPLVVEDIKENEIKEIIDGLYTIGIGCQILDDMVDFQVDIASRRHNYLASLIHHGDSKTERNHLGNILTTGEQAILQTDVCSSFPEAAITAAATAKSHLDRGLHQLFTEEHAFLVTPAIRFLQQRIAGPLSLKLL